MSLSHSVQLYFAMFDAPTVLRTLAGLLQGAEASATVVEVPGRGRFALPTLEGAGVEVLDVGSRIDFISGVPWVHRRKKRLARSVVDRWGEETWIKVIQTKSWFPATVGIGRGHEFFELSFGNLANDTIERLTSRQFLAQVGRIYSEGNGVAGVIDSGDGWYALADPNRPIELPDEFDHAEANLDALVAHLVAIL